MAFDNLQTGDDLPEGTKPSDPSNALLEQGIDLAYKQPAKDGAEELETKKQSPPKTEKEQYTKEGKKVDEEAQKANEKLDKAAQGKK